MMVKIALAISLVFLSFPIHAEPHYVLIDGKYIDLNKVETENKKAQATKSVPTNAGGTMIRTPDTTPAERSSLDTHKSAFRLLKPGSMVETYLYLEETNRQLSAREAAKKELTKSMDSSGSRYGLIAIMANHERPSSLHPSESIANGEQWSRDYKPSKASVSHSKQTLLEPLLQTEKLIKQANDANDAKEKFVHPSEFLIGQRDKDGKVVVRNFNSEDGAEFQKNEAKRIADESEKRASEARIAADKAADLAKKEATKMENDAAARKSAEKNAADAAERAKNAEQVAAAEKAAAKEMAEKQEARAKACSSGDADSCAKHDRDLNKLVTDFETRQHTARCMSDDNGGQPLAGPCSKYAPPCMYCNKVNEMSKEKLHLTLMRGRALPNMDGGQFSRSGPGR